MSIEVQSCILKKLVWSHIMIYFAVYGSTPTYRDWNLNILIQLCSALCLEIQYQTLFSKKEVRVVPHSPLFREAAADDTRG